MIGFLPPIGFTFALFFLSFAERPPKWEGWPTGVIQMIFIFAGISAFVVSVYGLLAMLSAHGSKKRRT